VIARARARRTDAAARCAPCAILSAYLISWSQSGVWRSGGVPYSTFLRRRRSIYRAARAAPGCCLPLLMLDSTSRNWPIASFRGDAEFGRYRVIAGPSEPSALQIMSSCTTAKQKPNKRKRTGMIGLQLVNASSASFEQKRSNANLLYLSLSFRLAVKNNHSMIPALCS
jgi:hypothetical protein